MQKLTASLAVVFAGVGLVACGDDGDGGGGVDAAYCTARVEIEAAFFAEPPAEGALGSALNQLEANAPSDLEDQTTVFVDAVRAEGPDALESEDVAEAGLEISEAVFDDCGFEQVEVTGVEYAFEGVPEDLPTGNTAFQFTNDGDEPHEMLIVRINDDVDESIDEIVQLPGREVRELITVTGAAFAESGGTDYSIINLGSGRYGMVCFVETADGTPHVVEGMVSEFEVS